MVGTVTPHSITLWARISGPYSFQVLIDNHPDMPDPRKSEAVQARKEDDFTVRLTVDDLQPGTRYYYHVLVEGWYPKYMSNRLPFQVKTAPATGEPVRFTLGFGSCSRVREDLHQPIWKQVQQANPDLFFWLGDNIYGDSLHIEAMADEYRSQRQVPTLQPVNWSIPQLATWDDHDYALNDHDRENPVKEMALKVFKQYWANPAYGLPDLPGVFFSYQYGGVDFFFLDCRYYRDPNTMPDGPGKTFLGKEQLEWLKDQLRVSQSPFKVIVSGSGFTSVKGHGGDSWASALYERDQILQFIREDEISGVVILSGDTHKGELNCLPESQNGGYDIYELVSSPLGQATSVNIQRQIPEVFVRRHFTDAPNFGYIIFDMTRDDPTLRFNLIDIYGFLGYPWFEVKASELVNGQHTWPDKIDRKEKARRDAGGYPDYQID